MASTGFNLNPTDKETGRALSIGLDAYISRHPDQFEHEVAERLRITPARLSGLKSGMAPMYVRELKALAVAGIWEPLQGIARQCRARLILEPRDITPGDLRPADAMNMLKECTEAASEIIKGLADGNFDEAEKASALRELDEAAIQIITVRRMVEEAKTARGVRA